MSGAASPPISVLMAVRNGQAFLGESIESVLGQTATDFEFLVADDGSTDGSRGLIEEFCRTDPRIRLIDRPGGGNRGVSASLNELFAKSSGEFIARMDADDVCCQGRFAAQVAFLREHPQVVAVGCQCDVIDSHGEQVGRIQRPSAHDAIEHRFFNGGGGIMHPAAMIRAESLRRIGGYDESLTYAQDLDLFLRLGEMGQLSNLNETLLKYRWHPGQISVGKRSHQLSCVASTLIKVSKRRKVSVSKQLIEIYGELAWRLRLEGKRLSAFRHACRVVALDPHRLLGWRYVATSLLGRRLGREAIRIEPEGQALS